VTQCLRRHQITKLVVGSIYTEYMQLCNVDENGAESARRDLDYFDFSFAARNFFESYL